MIQPILLITEGGFLLMFNTILAMIDTKEKEPHKLKCEEPLNLIDVCSSFL